MVLQQFQIQSEYETNRVGQGHQSKGGHLRQLETTWEDNEQEEEDSNRGSTFASGSRPATSHSVNTAPLAATSTPLLSPNTLLVPASTSASAPPSASPALSTSSSMADFYAARDAAMKGNGLFGGGGLEREVITKMTRTQSNHSQLSQSAGSSPNLPYSQSYGYTPPPMPAAGQAHTMSGSPTTLGSASRRRTRRYDTSRSASPEHSIRSASTSPRSANASSYFPDNADIPPLPSINQSGVNHDIDDYDPFRPKDESQDVTKDRSDAHALSKSEENYSALQTPPIDDQPMSRRQINRISMVLDQIEAELTKTYTKVEPERGVGSLQEDESEREEEEEEGDGVFDEQEDVTDPFLQFHRQTPREAHQQQNDETPAYDYNYDDYGQSDRENTENEPDNSGEFDYNPVEHQKELDRRRTFHSSTTSDQSHTGTSADGSIRRTGRDGHQQLHNNFIYDDTEEIDPQRHRLPFFSDGPVPTSESQQHPSSSMNNLTPEIIGVSTSFPPFVSEYGFAHSGETPIQATFPHRQPLTPDQIGYADGEEDGTPQAQAFHLSSDVTDHALGTDSQTAHLQPPSSLQIPSAPSPAPSSGSDNLPYLRPSPIITPRNSNCDTNERTDPQNIDLLTQNAAIEAAGSTAIEHSPQWAVPPHLPSGYTGDMSRQDSSSSIVLNKHIRKPSLVSSSASSSPPLSPPPDCGLPPLPVNANALQRALQIQAAQVALPASGSESSSIHRLGEPFSQVSMDQSRTQLQREMSVRSYRSNTSSPSNPYNRSSVRTNATPQRLPQSIRPQHTPRTASPQSDFTHQGGHDGTTLAHGSSCSSEVSTDSPGASKKASHDRASIQSTGSSWREPVMSGSSSEADLGVLLGEPAPAVNMYGIDEDENEDGDAHNFQPFSPRQTDPAIQEYLSNTAGGLGMEDLRLIQEKMVEDALQRSTRPEVTDVIPRKDDQISYADTHKRPLEEGLSPALGPPFTANERLAEVETQATHVASSVSHSASKPYDQRSLTATTVSTTSTPSPSSSSPSQSFSATRSIEQAPSPHVGNSSSFLQGEAGIAHDKPQVLSGQGKSGGELVFAFGEALTVGLTSADHHSPSEGRVHTHSPQSRPTTPVRSPSTSSARIRPAHARQPSSSSLLRQATAHSTLATHRTTASIGGASDALQGSEGAVSEQYPPHTPPPPVSMLRPTQVRASNATPSMLFRSVQQQATEATAALKPQRPPISPVAGATPRRTLSHRKSVKNLKIGTPQLVSGSTDVGNMPDVGSAVAAWKGSPVTSPAPVAQSLQQPSLTRKQSLPGLKFRRRFKGGKDAGETEVPPLPANIAVPAANGMTDGTSPHRVDDHQSGIKHLITKFRRRKHSDINHRLIPDPLVLNMEEQRQSQPSTSNYDHAAETTHSPALSQSSVGTEAFSNRSPVLYTVGRRRGPPSVSSTGTANLADTSPLQITPKTSPMAAAHSQQAGQVPHPQQRPQQADSASVDRSSAGSLDSMRKLFEAATALGLDPDRVHELVDAAGYRNHEATSSDERVVKSTIILPRAPYPPQQSDPASLSQKPGNWASAHRHTRNFSANSSLRRAFSAHERKTSVTSDGHNLTASQPASAGIDPQKAAFPTSDTFHAPERRSIHDRPPTPPPSRGVGHRRRKSEAITAQNPMPADASLPSSIPAMSSNAAVGETTQTPYASYSGELPSAALPPARTSLNNNKPSLGSYDARSIYGLYGDDEGSVPPPTPGLKELDVLLASGRIPASSRGGSRGSMVLAPGISAKRLSTASGTSRIELSEFANGDIAFNIVQSLRAARPADRTSFLPAGLHVRQASEASVESEILREAQAETQGPTQTAQSFRTYDPDPLRLLVRRHQKSRKDQLETSNEGPYSHYDARPRVSNETLGSSQRSVVSRYLCRIWEPDG